MRHWLYIIGVVLLCLCSCRNKANTFVLEGHVSSLAHDTIYIYGADALFECIDTVVTRDGTFRYTATVDTVVPMWVLFPNRHREMVFADKGLKATLQGDTAAAGHIYVEGGEQNALLRTFYERIDSLSDVDRVTWVADSFIRANPYSEVSIHLLREYFVHIPSPDNTKIKTLIGSMSGNLQDNNYIKQLQRSLNVFKPLSRNSVISSYSINDSEGKNVTTSDYKDTYLLISFWASWDAESRERQRELIALKEKYRERNFDILGVSLDTDRAAWLQAIEADSLTWRQANDFDAWNTSLVQRVQVDRLPANVLLNPQRRIQAINLFGSDLDHKIGELTVEKQTEKSPAKKTPATIKNQKLKIAAR